MEKKLREPLDPIRTTISEKTPRVKGEQFDEIGYPDQHLGFSGAEHVNRIRLKGVIVDYKNVLAPKSGPKMGKGYEVWTIRLFGSKRATSKIYF